MMTITIYILTKIKKIIDLALFVISPYIIKFGGDDMKRYFAIIFIIFLSILLILSNERSFENYVSSMGVDGEFLNETTYKICGKINDTFLDKIDINILSKKCLEDRVIIEGYTDKIVGYRVLNNCKVNLQISISEDCVILGSPLITGSF